MVFVQLRRFLGHTGGGLALLVFLVAHGGCEQVAGLNGYGTGEIGLADGSVLARPVDGASGSTPPVDATGGSPADSPDELDGAALASDGAACPSTAPTTCSGGCVDPTSDPNNCSACGHACTTAVANAQPTCVNGACAFACTVGHSACGGQCVDYSSDENNCGGCGTVCSLTCQSGVCLVPYAYAPSNFTATTYTDDVPSAATTVNCNVTYTSPGTAGPSTWCGGTGPYVVPNVAQVGGPSVDILLFNSLTVSAGFAVTLRGTLPVIFAVYGDATIGGTITASASGSTPGAGGNIAAYCGTAPQDSQDAQWGGGGGGGRAVPGGKGNEGNVMTGGFDNGGAASGTSGAVPLVGGCSGEIGGNLCNGANCQQCQVAGNACEPPGAGGGGVQISAAGTVSVAGLVAANGSGGTSGGMGQNGGGGGGSAGDVLLEGNAVTVGGSLSANGGPGGAGGTNGGTGGTAGTAGMNDGTTKVAPGNGTGGSGANQGGGGGGGAYGYVVIGVR
jgi:hypothetical protein